MIFLEDRSIYFAGPSSRFVAEDYARNWRQGIIQVTIPNKEYIKHFKMYERPLLGNIGGVELKIPIKAGVRLSTYPRFLTPY